MKSNHNNQNKETINENKKNLKEIKFIKDLVEDSYSPRRVGNSFISFKLVTNNYCIVYTDENKSIICYDIVNNSKIIEIKNAHETNIIVFRHYYDPNNKRDLILSISSEDKNLKIWDINQGWKCILDLKKEGNGKLISACLLFQNKQIYILIGMSIHDKQGSPVEVYDINGKLIKKINDLLDNINYIDIYYDNAKKKNFIITAGFANIKIFDYKKNLIYNRISSYAYNVIINNKNGELTIILCDSYGFVTIYDFHTGKMLNKIKVSKNGINSIFLWDEDNLVIGCEDKKIKILDLKTKKIIKTLIGHNNIVSSFQKITLPEYGECLISQAFEKDKIKLWG